MKIKKRIVYCIPSLYISGGMERVLTIKANYFADYLGYDIYIILTDGKGKTPFYKLSPKIQIINLDINYDELWGKPLIIKIFRYLKKQYLFKKKLRDCLLNIKPDITITTLRREINFINSIKDGSKKIGEIHFSKNNYRNIKNNKTLPIIKECINKLWMNQLIRNLKKLDKFVVLTDEDKNNWIELNNTVTINNPLAFFPEKVSSCTNHQVIAAGRYSPEKGFDKLINAWALVIQKHPDWTLRIFGNGDSKNYKDLINTLNLKKSCILEQAVNNIEDKFCESSILVLSSSYEGFGMVISEAMACGIPAVSFACPCGPKDIIKNGIDGILVENGNIQKLAKNICFLIENENIRKKMGQKARINITRLKIENVSKQWETLFNEITN